jgi:sensor histidine kinase YesM
VDVSAHEKEDFVYIQISDTGLGSGNASTNGGGIGLEHVRERLSAAYGGAASLSMENNPSGGMTVTVKIPAGK